MLAPVCVYVFTYSSLYVSIWTVEPQCSVPHGKWGVLNAETYTILNITRFNFVLKH